MKLYIKNMVSHRCKMRVEEELSRLGLHPTAIELGMAEIQEDISKVQRAELQRVLLCSGLELLENKKNILIERIKAVVTEMIHYSTQVPKMNYSDYISMKLDYDYTYLSNIFSESKGMTIQHFIILNKIEKVKELLLYGERNLTEISNELHYSSVAHLSSQFKKTTGLTPSYYKQLKENRKLLESM